MKLVPFPFPQRRSVFWVLGITNCSDREINRNSVSFRSPQISDHALLGSPLEYITTIAGHVYTQQRAPNLFTHFTCTVREIKYRRRVTNRQSTLLTNTVYAQCCCCSAPPELQRTQRTSSIPSFSETTLHVVPSRSRLDRQPSFKAARSQICWKRLDDCPSQRVDQS